MNPLLISGFGTSINVEKSKLIISNKLKNTKYEFYPHKMNHDNIILDNHSGNISFDAIKWLMKHDIQLSILNWNGNLLGVTMPESPKLGNIRIKQYQKYLNHDIRYEIAEKIVYSKIESSFNLIKELSNYYLIQLKSVESTFKSELNNYLIKKKDRKTDFTNLLAFEGRIAQIYFEKLIKIISELAPEFNFNKRLVEKSHRNYNAADEVNALLNYGYAILESQIKKEINSVGLDPQIGFLHELSSNSSPLVYDIQELFRWLVDLSVIELLEEQPKLKRSDFILTENYNIRLKDKTAKRLIAKIKLNFNKKIPYKGKRFQYSTILADFVRNLALFMGNKKSEIDYFIPEIKIKREDSLELKDKIQSLTPDQRRKLGINKSTFWYIKKNIKNGKSIKIYDKVLSKLGEL